ncbi:MAG: hypothetical protein WAQ27_01825 [Candidatus Microsaccharimonas sp.]
MTSHSEHPAPDTATPKEPTHQPVVHQPAPTVAAVEVPPPTRLGKLKLAFLYVLIGGLAASALVSIVALLIGSFNSEIQKSLLTIFVFFSHSLFILALLWSDKNNDVGRSVLPTAIFVLALANMVTTTLSTWEIISAETAWRALGLYMLTIGAVFVITGTLKLRINQQATKVILYATVATISALVLALAPWVLEVVSEFSPLYYRIVAALSILGSTLFIIALIIRGIALAHNPELAATKPVAKPIPGGLLAIYITVGTIAAIVWCSGFAGFIISAVQSSQPSYDKSNYNRYY